MKISGYGEFQQMRKMSQKDDAQLKESAERAKENADESGDAVVISAEGRRKSKLRQAPDVRQAKIDAVRERLENGTLVTPESLKTATTKMLDGLIAGDL
ncbi:MAG: flagellar biosynthesis anti-sigma factor FlgM [Planctomycetes bacterium]|nr:flagellar biosynthesis anti-sigma factor FlgM [Planctomycetota bacterium]